MPDGVTLALAAGVVIVALIWLLLPSAEQRRFNKAPGPAGLPILGNIHQLPYESTGKYRFLNVTVVEGSILTAVLPHL